MPSAEMFSKWLSAYAEAWEAGDPEAIVQFFTADAPYYLTPFHEPMVGTEAIRQYWTRGAWHERDLPTQAEEA